MIRGLAATAEPVASDIDATLNRLRMRSDPLADAVALRLDLPPAVSATSELRFMARCEIGIYQELLDHACTPPAGTDPALVEQGRQIQLAFTPARDLAWLCGALPQGLGQCPLLHPRQFPRELRQRLRLHRHINQTLSEPHCLQPGGTLHELLLQQRLHWALQRKTAREQGWNPLEFGEPLNQEYLLLMLLEYSRLTLQHMARLGARLSSDDADAVVAFWNLTLYWLGLDKAAIPQDGDCAAALLRRILWRYSHDDNRRQQQRLTLNNQIQQYGSAIHSPALLRAIWQWNNPEDGALPALDRNLRWLIAANRGATLAHYHLPGVDLLRQHWRSRQLRQDIASDDTDIVDHKRQIA